MREVIGWVAKLREADESDVLLCAGVEALFLGVSMIHLPSAIILAGIIFVGLAYISAPRQGVTHGVA